MMNRQTRKRQMDRRINRTRDVQTERKRDRRTVKETEGKTKISGGLIETDKQTEKEMYKDRQTKVTNRKKTGQTNK